MTPELSPESTEVAISRNLRQIVRQWPILSLCMLFAGLAAYFVSSSAPKMYAATTVLEVAAPDDLARLTQGSTFTTPESDDREASTIAALITQPSVLRRAAQPSLGFDASQLSSALEVVVSNDANLVEVTAMLDSPSGAASAANATAQTFVRFRQEQRTEDNIAAQRQIRQQLASLDGGKQDTSVRDQLNQRLRTVKALAAGGTDVRIVQDALIPSEAVSPRPKRLAFIGLLAGFCLGLAIALIRARFDDRIRDPREFGELWALPLVASVPKSRKLGSLGRELPPSNVLEAFSSARTNLRYLHVGGEVRTLAVTSAGAGEGKSTAVWHLALAAALADSRVLIIEADLRRPQMAARLDAHSNGGLTDVLAGLRDADEAVVSVPFVDHGRGLSGSVDLISAGALPPSPIALLEKDRLRKVLEALRPAYDLILIGSPPTTVGDALIIAAQADSVLVIGRPATSKRRAFVRLKEQLAGTGAPVLGLLLDGWSVGVTYGYQPYGQSSRDVGARSRPLSPMR